MAHPSPAQHRRLVRPTPTAARRPSRRRTQGHATHPPAAPTAQAPSRDPPPSLRVPNLKLRPPRAPCRPPPRQTVPRDLPDPRLRPHERALRPLHRPPRAQPLPAHRHTIPQTPYPLTDPGWIRRSRSPTHRPGSAGARVDRRRHHAVGVPLTRPAGSTMLATCRVVALRPIVWKGCATWLPASSERSSTVRLPRP